MLLVEAELLPWAVVVEDLEADEGAEEAVQETLVAGKSQ